MSSEDKSRKTEKATHRKLKKSRKKGQVAKSKEVTSTLMLIAAVIYFWLGWDWMLGQLQTLIERPAFLYDWEFEAGYEHLYEFVIRHVFFSLLVPFTLLLFIFALLGNIVQFGLLFSVDPMIPRADKINPVKGLSRVFNMKSFAEAGISLFKIFLIAFVVYLVISTSLGDMVHNISTCNVGCKREVMESLISKVVLYVLPLLLVMMVADYLVQRAHFLKEQRMTKEEVKQEMKESEGDPLVKSVRRGLAQEFLNDDLPERVSQARVVVTDGAIAVPLRYQIGETPLPIILAIGKGALAAKITDIAAQEEVVIVNDPALAQMLEEEGKIDEFIPDIAIKRTARVIQAIGG